MLTFLAIVSGFLTVIYFAIYFIGNWIARPEFTVRFCGTNNENPPIIGYKSYFSIGVSTERSVGAVIRSVRLEPLSREPVHFKGSDIFELQPSGSRVALEWKGEKRLQRGNFVIFAVPYEAEASARHHSDIIVSISLTGTVSPEAWGKPWSMFSLGNRTTQFVKRLQWKPQPDAGEETGFKLEPFQGVELFGKAAEDSVLAHSQNGELNVDVTEIFKDGSYSRHSVQKSPAPHSSATPQK